MASDEKNAELELDWLRALESDAAHFGLVINRVESLGILAIDDIEKGNIKNALVRLAQMGEGIRVCKVLVGVK